MTSKIISSRPLGYLEATTYIIPPSFIADLILESLPKPRVRSRSLAENAENALDIQEAISYWISGQGRRLNLFWCVHGFQNSTPRRALVRKKRTFHHSSVDNPNYTCANICGSVHAILTHIMVMHADMDLSNTSKIFYVTSTTSIKRSYTVFMSAWSLLSNIRQSDQENWRKSCSWATVDKILQISRCRMI